MSDWNEYQDALQKTDESTREKIRSSLISDCVAATVSKHELDTSHTKILVQIYVDVLLDLVTPEVAVEKIKSAAIPEAAMVHTEIWNCMQTSQPTSADSSEQITAQYRDDTTTETVAAPDKRTAIPPLQSAKVVEKPHDSLASDIAETEAALNAIPKIRTMVQDAQESTTHTSSQAELLDKNNRWFTKEQ